MRDTSFTVVSEQTPLSVSSASSALTLSGTGKQIRLFNDGLVTLYYAFGTGALTVTAVNGTGLPAGAVELVTLPEGATKIAAITASSTTSLKVTRGWGT